MATALDERRAPRTAGIRKNCGDPRAKDTGVDAVAYDSGMGSGRHPDAIRGSRGAAGAIGIGGAPSFEAAIRIALAQ